MVKGASDSPASGIGMEAAAADSVVASVLAPAEVRLLAGLLRTIETSFRMAVVIMSPFYIS